MLLWGMQFSNFFRFGVHFHGGGQFINIYPYSKWGFKDSGEALLWGSLSGLPGDQLFGADAGGSVYFLLNP